MKAPHIHSTTSSAGKHHSATLPFGPATIQPKLTIGQPGDKYEREADAMADRVMAKLAGGSETMVQPKCSSCENEELQRQPLEEELPVREKPIQRKCADCAAGQEDDGMVQAKGSDSTPVVSTGLRSQLNASKGSGSSLPDHTRSTMESAFGADFSGVRVHTGSQAIHMNRDINAQAFTHGSDIYFNEGKYDTASSRGQHLLAHELTHVVQQGGNYQLIQRTIGNRRDFPVDSRFTRNHALEAVLDNERTVEDRNNGTHVELIQQALTDLGYQLPVFGVDGDFGDETRRAVEAFQTDVGLDVDGVVGFRTIDFLDKRDRNAEVAPPESRAIANTAFDVANAVVRPGTPPSLILPANAWGHVNGENIEVRIDIFDNVGTWQPVLREVIGNYSLQTRLLPGVQEVTGPGPGGNTTRGNFCQQINNLDSLSQVLPKNWYMLSAILAHERVHASFLRQALIHHSVIDPLETSIENVTVTIDSFMRTPEIASTFIENHPNFTSALTTALANWSRRWLLLGGGHPAITNDTILAETEVVSPMIRRICDHARANGWPACPPICT